MGLARSGLDASGEGGAPGSDKIQSVSLTPRCFARESCMLQYHINVCADHCAFA